MKRSGPLKRRTPLRATAPAKTSRERAPLPAYRLTRAPNYATCSVAAEPVPRPAPVRSEAYKRLVASLPCIHCGIEGFSNHAHANTGKGVATKVCDLFAFPLCVDRPGVMGCHSMFDQHALFRKGARRVIEVEWARRTVLFIVGAGRWPQDLAVPDWAAA